MLETLTAIRDKQSTYNMTTTLKDCKGFVKIVLTGYNQSTKRQKTLKQKENENNLSTMVNISKYKYILYNK